MPTRPTNPEADPAPVGGGTTGKPQDPSRPPPDQQASRANAGPSKRRPHAPGSGMLVISFWLVLALAATLLFIARAKFPGPESGEFWSDANIINATRGWDEIGFSTTWGIPRLARAAPLDDKAFLYLTYPPGPYWLSYGAMLLGKSAGVEPVLAARLFAQACGITSAGLLFFLFRRLSGSRAIAALGAMFYILSPAFLSYSAALHHMAYSPMVLFAAMLAWLGFEDARGLRRILCLALTALLFAIDCYLNFEHMFLFALFVGVRTAFNTSWQTIVGAGLIGPIPIPMMALRVWHNAQVLGGWDASMSMFRASAERRSASSQFGVDLGDLAQVWAGRLGWPWIKSPTIDNVWNTDYPYPVLDPWVLLAIGAILVTLVVQRLVRARKPATPKGPMLSLVDPSRTLLPVHPEDGAPRGPRFLFWRRWTPGPVASGLLGGLLLLACGLTWFVVMTQHTRPHRFIVLLLMPGLSLLLGTLAWSVIASARRSMQGRSGVLAAWVRARAWLLALAMLVVFGVHVRRADVLNQLAPLDEQAHTRINVRVRGNTDVQRAGERLAAEGVERVQMFDGVNMMPWRAAAIRLPFIYIRRSMVDAIQPTDAVYVEAWDRAEIRAALDAAERFGLPDLIYPPGDRALVFRGSRPEGDKDVRLDLALGGNGAHGETAPMVIRSVRWGEALARGRASLVVLVSGDFEAAAAAGVLDRYVLTLRLRGPNGRVLHEAKTRVRWAPIRDETRALVILVAPEELPAATSIAEFSIWDREVRAAVDLFREGAGRSAPPTIDPAGRWMRWDVSAPESRANR